MADFSIVFVLINSFLVIRICRSSFVHLLTKILLCVSYFGWNAAPALLMYIPSVLGIDYRADDTYILCSYYNEVFLFFAYCLAFGWMKRAKMPKFLSINDFQNRQLPFHILLYASLILAVYKTIVLSISSRSYWDANDLANLAAIGPLDFISSLGLFFLLGALFLSKERMSSFVYRLSFLIVLLYFLIHFLRGGRIYIFGIVVLLLYLAISRRNRIALITGVVVGALALGLLPALADLRGSDKIDAKSIKISSASPISSEVLTEILIKTNSVMYGSYLIDKDGIGNWGGKMYTSTIYALVPRFIYPSKPEPGSVDGTQYGLPARASSAYSVSGSYDDIGNNGVPASLSSLWGGGWLAYFIEIITTAFLIFIINSVFYSKKPIFAGFVFSLLAFPVGVLEVPLPTVLVSVQRDIVIYFVLAILLSSLGDRSKGKEILGHA